MLGAQPNLLLLTLCSMLFSWAFFFFLVFPLLPIIYEPFKYVAVVLCYCNFILAINTACTDPGIIPISENDFIHFMEDCFEHCSYCSLCKIYRPLRARHCRYCNNCILVNLDHYFYLLIVILFYFLRLLIITALTLVFNLSLFRVVFNLPVLTPPLL